MEFITSKNFEMPANSVEMEKIEWFNMWKTKQYPYDELNVDDILCFYETPTKRIVWKARVVQIYKYPYSDKKEISDKLDSMKMYGKEYFDKKPDKGYYLGYKVKVETIEKIELKKSIPFRFPRLGWMKVDTISAYFK